MTDSGSSPRSPDQPTPDDLRFQERCAAAACRSCGRSGLDPILDLGQMPHSDGLLTAEQLSQTEERWPLELAFCPHCTLVQILETVAPEKLFGEDYPYFSSFSESWVAHARDHVQELVERHGLTADSLAVEIASNDGYLLRHFLPLGIRVLGIDPAPGPAKAATEIGVPTRVEFFGAGLARELRDAGQAADVLIANNVVAHVADTNGLVEGLATLLAPGGELTVEFPYVHDLISKGQFDTIYHQHLCYFSLRSADTLFRRHGLYINDVRRLSTHGGSLRLYIHHTEQPQPSVQELLHQEAELGLQRLDYYRSFAENVQRFRGEMRDLLQDLRSMGKRIAAYGAAAKGTILLNYVGLGNDMIDYVVDRNVHKHGRYIPGVQIPIDSPARLETDRPDYLLILPWNLTEEIIAQQASHRAAGGRFIVPIPALRVI